MIPPAAAPVRAPMAAPRWVLGPVGAAQLESAIAATALVMASMDDFMMVEVE